MNGPIVMAISENSVADTGERIFIGKGDEPAWLTFALANRHGLVTGATGSGKTVSLQVMAEGFARAGVPVFAADIKGDLSGISEVGEPKDFIVKRAGDMGLTFQPDRFSTVFWDVFGEQGHPVRATVSEMGPLLLSRMMDLNDVQEGVLNVAFKVADEQGLLLLDMKDLRAILSFIAEHAADLTTQYGNVSKQTVGTIQRQLLVLENQGGARFFGEPALALKDKIEQVVRLIRSKGVGVYFVTQNPIDVPDKVLAQLGNRVQHALRAFTPRDQKAVAAAAQTFRPNPRLDTAQVIMELGKGEALVSFLEGNGVPAMVERVMIRPPTARIGPITPEERKAIMDKSPVKGKYDTTIDSESAYEVLQKRVAATAAGSAGGGGILGEIGSIVGTIFGTNTPRGKMSTGQIIARSVTRS